MTNNVLASPSNPQPDMGPEVTPKVRVDSDWARHALSFEANADRIWYSESPSPTSRTISSCRAGSST